MRTGDFFGEVSLFRNEPRAASAQAVSDCTLLALPDRPLPPPDRRASRLQAAAGAAHPAVRLPPRRQRAARLRRGDPAGGSVGPARLARTGRARARAGGRSIAGHGRDGEAAPDPPVPARLPARRDGLRRRLPGDDLPPLRPRGRHLAHPPGGPHLDRRDDARRDHARRRGARPLGPLGPRSKSRLDDLPLPAVVHWEGNHWVVVYRVDDKHVRVSDPARGLRKIPREEFLERWSGYSSVVGYTERLADAPEARTSLAWIRPFLRPHRRLVPVRGRARDRGSGARARPADPDPGRRRPRPPDR